jgi:hypothetical protein
LFHHCQILAGIIYREISVCFRGNRLAELQAPPRCNTANINRYDGPEDGTLGNRCLTPGLPEFGGVTGSFRRIVQTPGGITMFYDVGQGQGWQRNIVMDGSSHLPSNIRQWFGDSRHQQTSGKRW